MHRLVVMVLVGLLVMRVGWGRQEGLPVGTRVRLTIPTIDYPQYSDSQTIVRRGEWEVRIKGYTTFIPGDVIVVEGVVDQRGRVNESKVLSTEYREFSGVDYWLVQVAHIRHWAKGRLQRVLPEPHASLAIGILLGVRQDMPRDFYEQLVKTGTLHVVAASGYNVSVVAGVVMAGMGLIMPRYLALGVSLGGVGLYVLLAGAGPAIVRAGIMGSLTLIGIMLGKRTEARRLLGIAGWGMLMVKPALLGEVGFQLSIAATAGLLYLEPWLRKLQSINSKSQTKETETQNQEYLKPARGLLAEYFYPSLAATLSTAPIIWWHFGRIAGIGVLVNMLVLPVVPLIMLLSALTVGLSPVGYWLYVPLWWVVTVIRWFGQI